MIDLTGKSVFVKTWEEYIKILKIARLQGFTWVRAKCLDAIDIPMPNILKFYDNKTVTYENMDKPIYEASKIVAYVEKLEEAVILAREFIMNPDGITLTESFLKSLELLANNVESQLEEVK